MSDYIENLISMPEFNLIEKWFDEYFKKQKYDVDVLYNNENSEDKTYNKLRFPIISKEDYFVGKSLKELLFTLNINFDNVYAYHLNTALSNPTNQYLLTKAKILCTTRILFNIDTNEGKLEDNIFLKVYFNQYEKLVEMINSLVTV